MTKYPTNKLTGCFLQGYFKLIQRRTANMRALNNCGIRIDSVLKRIKRILRR
jgi:hypothetical protein